MHTPVNLPAVLGGFGNFRVQCGVTLAVLIGNDHSEETLVKP